MLCLSIFTRQFQFPTFWISNKTLNFVLKSCQTSNKPLLFLFQSHREISPLEENKGNILVKFCMMFGWPSTESLCCISSLHWTSGMVWTPASQGILAHDKIVLLYSIFLNWHNFFSMYLPISDSDADHFKSTRFFF